MQINTWLRTAQATPTQGVPPTQGAGPQVPEQNPEQLPPAEVIETTFFQKLHELVSGNKWNQILKKAIEMDEKPALEWITTPNEQTLKTFGRQIAKIASEHAITGIEATTGLILPGWTTVAIGKGARMAMKGQTLGIDKVLDFLSVKFGLKEWLQNNMSLASIDDALQVLSRVTTDPEVVGEVGMMVRLHAVPPRDNDVKTKDILRASLSVPLDLLCILARADMKGRKTSQQDVIRVLDSIELFGMQAKDLKCFDTPASFPNDYTRFKYFNDQWEHPQIAAYDYTRFCITLMCGLPGAGKDYWISHNMPDTPAISLDDIRQDMGISPAQKSKQHLVVTEAHERAKIHIQKGESFIINGTNISRFFRSKWREMATRRQGSFKIVHVEPGLDVCFKRNASRQQDKVPEGIIRRMHDNMELPDLSECYQLTTVRD